MPSPSVSAGPPEALNRPAVRAYPKPSTSPMSKGRPTMRDRATPMLSPAPALDCNPGSEHAENARSDKHSGPNAAPQREVFAVIVHLHGGERGHVKLARQRQSRGVAPDWVYHRVRQHETRFYEQIVARCPWAATVALCDIESFVP